MKKFKVIFHHDAVSDINASFDWGVEVWGKEQTVKWAKEFYSICRKRLSQFPATCPVAPESAEFDTTIRQLLIGRYRVLFIIEENTVEIIYVRGPYIESDADK